MKKAVDVVIIGGGHNGLVAAGLLSRAGVDVTLFERAPTLGGLAGTIEVEGRPRSLAAEDLGLLRSDIADRLELCSHGWQPKVSSDLVGWRSPTSHGENGPGRSLRLFCERDRLVDAVAEHSRRDAAEMPNFLDTVERLSASFEASLRQQPTAPVMARVARHPELMRFLSASMDDLLGWWFTSDAVRVALAGLALHSTGLGPLDQGTGYLLLHQLAGSGGHGLRPLVRDLPGASGLIEALAASASASGARLVTGRGIAQVEVEAGCQRGLVFEDGDRLEARLVLSTLDARATLTGLVGSASLPVRAVRALRSLRYQGASARCILGERINEAARPGSLPRSSSEDGLRTVVSSSVEDLQRAQDALKYGRASKNPWLVCGGGSITAHSLPFGACADTETVTRFQQACRDLWLAAMGTSSPDPENSRWLLPTDWQRLVAATEGSSTGGEMTLDQSYLGRPLPSWSGCETPVSGLLLAGAGAHPGGGVTGLPGLAAASAAMQQLGVGRSR